jgi:UrcA family protein
MPFPAKTPAFTLATLALAPVAVIFGAPVATAEQSVQRQVTVDYSDLDLSREEGVRTLMGRIEKASDKVCGDRPATDTYGQLTDFKACRVVAIGDAVRRIDQPAVTLAWQGEAKPVSVASR